MLSLGNHDRPKKIAYVCAVSWSHGGTPDVVSMPKP